MMGTITSLTRVRRERERAAQARARRIHPTGRLIERPRTELATVLRFPASPSPAP